MGVPSEVPSKVPSSMPSDMPSTMPSEVPSSMPSDMPSEVPSKVPSSMPSDVPSSSSMPSEVPSSMPSDVPSSSSMPSKAPSSMPSKVPSSVLGLGSVMKITEAGGDLPFTLSSMQEADNDVELRTFIRGDFASSSEYADFYWRNSTSNENVFIGRNDGGSDCQSNYHE